ncbi:HTH-type transcriptional regulator ArgP [Amantichitinum ursilacus]|uniref:Chromosome initiation inhibitor n=1 Tax=Amantichitinum ursilacus TaxID=857265 RepID=A0A0N0GPN7_9NEIS|nr:HTH-type transcriptional regulator ArgP [Amantichitinum ursilacus]KPC53884.1 Chromosome initiation inhibitor [Amantichitinum ursilacus]
MNLDPKQTDALRAVIETGSFEQAAQALFVTPSAVSQRVRALEIALGSALLLRTRPVRATQTGQRLLQYLRRVALLQHDLDEELNQAGRAPLSISVAVNADTLATWFMPALGDLLSKEQLLLDLIVEDQEHTYALLESGMAIGCVSTQTKPMKGCVAEPLGAMRYCLVASPTFAQQWFAAGLTRASARNAPVVAQTHKDELHVSFLQKQLGLPAGSYPCHYVPGAEPQRSAILAGIGYGMLPESLIATALADGALVDLAAAHAVEVALFWHVWQVQSPRLEALSSQFVARARTLLAR